MYIYVYTTYTYVYIFIYLYMHVYYMCIYIYIWGHFQMFHTLGLSFLRQEPAIAIEGSEVFLPILMWKP